MMKWLSLVLLLFVTSQAFTQAGMVKRALKQLKKEDFDKVEQVLEKIKKKDSLYSGLHFVQARLYFTDSFHGFDIDSAHLFLLKARQLTGILDVREPERLTKAGAGALDFEDLGLSLDSAAFTRAKSINTEAAYIYFLENFSATQHDSEAVSLRNQSAFEEALNTNTYQAYRIFMDKYPTSEQYDDAEGRYERLFFEKSTADGKLESFRKFLDSHRSTPYRSEVEQRIYAVMTADYSAKSFSKFKADYPSSYLAKEAEQFEYHLAGEYDLAFRPIYFADSLAKMGAISSHLLLYLQGQKYGLMSLDGIAVTEAKYANPDPAYICDGVNGDVFLSNETLYSTSGVPIAFNVKSINDLGSGLVAIKYDNGIRVIHKSGKLIHKGVFDDVRFVKKQFLAFEVKGKWGMRTISGIDLIQPEYDNIFVEGTYVLFEKDAQFDVKTADQLIDAADNNPIKLQFLYDDFELLENGSLWLNSGDGQVIFDQFLNEQIPYRQQEIDFLPSGYSITTDLGHFLLNDSFEKLNKRPYSKLFNNANYIIVEIDSTQKLLRTDNYDELAELYRVELYGSKFAVGFKPDTTIVYGNNGLPVIIPFSSEPSLISSTDAKEFLKISDKKKTIIISEDGNRYELIYYDDFSSLDDFLITNKNQKRGVIYKDERELAPKYDAIGLQEEGLTLLLNGKFGLYAKTSDLLIESRYEKRLQKYGSDLFIGFRGNEHVFLNHNGKKIASIKGVEIVEYWLDSVALAKNNDGWRFFNIYDNTFSPLSMKSFVSVKSKGDEIVIIALGEKGYGVLSNIRGEIIPMTFNDVVQIGPEDSPVYFTEKHISEAEFYVVIYYDSDGNVLRKQAFDSSDYDLIYCDK